MRKIRVVTFNNFRTRLYRRNVGGNRPRNLYKKDPGRQFPLIPPCVFIEFCWNIIYDYRLNDECQIDVGGCHGHDSCRIDYGECAAVDTCDIDYDGGCIYDACNTVDYPFCDAGDEDNWDDDGVHGCDNVAQDIDDPIQACFPADLPPEEQGCNNGIMDILDCTPQNETIWQYHGPA